MAKRQPVMLAHDYDSRKHNVAGWMVSEKLDGIRCWWDGGVSRGERVRNVPWANTAKDPWNRDLVSTGLWSRYYKSIQAPDWWVDCLPNICLDGELYSNYEYRLSWEEITSVVKRIYPSGVDLEKWKGIGYYVFDSPPLIQIVKDGSIDITNLKKEIVGVREWARDRGINEGLLAGDYYGRPFEQNYEWLVDRFDQNSVFKILAQRRIPRDGGKEYIEKELDGVITNGGEGLIVRSPYSIWKAEKSWELLKIKGEMEAEGRVVGYVGGKGKLSGMFGALILDFRGKRLELSGFSDAERMMMIKISDYSHEIISLPKELEGMEVGEEFEGVHFKRGDVVTFRYRELSDSGIPKEARYWRKRGTKGETFDS